jgi:hypothetical protein
MSFEDLARDPSMITVVDLDNPVFVFGSNEGGKHGAGAACTARKYYGAIYGQAEGMQGNSYGIPTVDSMIRRSLGLKEIGVYVRRFLDYSDNHPEINFKITRIGCGLAGLKDKDIAPMFKNASKNCFFDTKWRPWLKKEQQYWGTF